MNEMNYIHDFCCFCLSTSNEKCSKDSSKYLDNLTPFDKIKIIFVELSSVMNTENRICLKCSDIVDYIYKFNRTCLKNINILNSYKNVLKENKSKIKYDPFVNLDEAKQLKDPRVLEDVEIGSIGPCLNNDDTPCNAGFVSESHSSSVAVVKGYIQINYVNCDEKSERSLLDSEIKIEIKETDLKQEWTSEISDSLMDEFSKSTFKEMNKLEQFNVNIATSSEVKIEPPESPLNNDDFLNDAEYVSKNYSSGAAEVKEEIEIDYETRDEESQRTWSDSGTKIDIKETNLKQEWTSKISDSSFNESLKSTIQDFEDFPVRSAEEVVVKEENSDLVEDLPEVSGSEEHSSEKLGYSESQEEKHSNSFQKIPIHANDQEFDLNRHLLSHSETENHTERRAHKCDTCGKLFKNKSTLKNHMMIHTGEKPHKCDICESLFTHKASLRKHILIHTGEKSYKCDTCGKLFTHKNSFKNHMLIHTGEKPHKCNICGSLFTHKVSLRDHVLIHTGEKPHKCDTCGRSFTRKEDLKSHMLLHTGEKPHKCDICGKSFTRKEHLKSHMLLHSDEKPHKCDTCGKTFNQKTYLRLHMFIHTGEVPHKCDICGKSFTHKAYLKNHMLIHTGEKPHKCETCGKLFTYKSDLKKHTLIHTGEKPHKCDICGKLFTQNVNLKSHMLIHTGEKPHKCDVCGKLFTYKTDLKKHMLIHTGESPYKCDTCGKSFKQKKYLESHKLIHTG